MAQWCDLSATAPLPALPGKHVYLHPGQLVFMTEPAAITTILGPCVSVCLFHNESRVAGVNHYLVPMKLADSPRCAEVANAQLLAKFTERGIEPAALKAKVFGGATMRFVKSDLAERNVSAAFEFLRDAGIAVAGSDVGGDRGRKLLFRTTDGTAWIRFL
jgi:chemotaxis protein CheD